MEKIKNKLKLKKENIITYSIILILSIILCSNFIKFHTVPDTYIMLVEKGYNCYRYFNEGRIVIALFLYFGYLLNIPLQALTVFMAVFSIVCLSSSAYIIYNVFAEKEDSLLKKGIMLIGSMLILFNPLSIEHLAYVESGIMSLGSLLCVMAAKTLVIDNKKILPIITVSLAALCYQGIINIFITVTALFIIFQDSSWKEKIKQFVLMCLCCIIAVLVQVVIIKIVNYNIDAKTSRDIGIWFDKSLLHISTVVLINDWNLYPRYFIITVIMVSTISLLITKDIKYTLKYIFAVIIAILACSIPATYVKEMTLGMAARTTTAVGSIIGISVIMLGKKIDNKIIITLITGVILAVDAYTYINNGVMISISNKLEEEYLQKIVTDVKKYENETGNEIKNICIYYDANPQATFRNFPNNSFTVKALITIYARRHILEYYLERDLMEIEENIETYKYFKTKDWDEYSIEQLIFDEDTLNLCVY